jgi:hypothetical protein
MLDYILVMLGGALGTGARFWHRGRRVLEIAPYPR